MATTFPAGDPARPGDPGDPGATDAPAAEAAGPPLLRQLAAPRAEPDRRGAAPDDESLASILSAAVSVPDHGSLRPWRFVVVRGPARERFGEALAEGLRQQRGGDAPEAAVTKMRGKAFAAPCCVVVVATPQVEANVPIWEQEASAACAGYAIVLAAQSLGLGSVWKSASTVDAPAVRALFGLGAHDRLMGWVNLGTAAPPRTRRAMVRPSLDEVVTVLGEDAVPPG